MNENDEYDFHQLMYQQFGAVDCVLEYTEKIREKARIIEYCLTGTIRERLNDIMFDLLCYGRIDRRRLGKICYRMRTFRGAVIQFFGLEKRDNFYYPTVDFIHKIISYGKG